MCQITSLVNEYPKNTNENITILIHHEYIQYNFYSIKNSCKGLSSIYL
jgi:hypothetical protein